MLGRCPAPRRGGSRPLAALLVAFALIALSGASPAQADSCRGEGDTITAAHAVDAERVLLCLVNAHRDANGLAPLTADPALTVAARNHSRWMDENDRLCHAPDNPDTGSCDGDPAGRAAAAGYPYPVGENIAWTNFPGYTPREMFELWHNSPGHNANMLASDYVTAGMGLVVGGHGVVGTQMFGVTENGGTDTAVNLLVRDGCAAAEQALDAAQGALTSARNAQASAQRDFARARRKVKRARSRAERKRAERALARARRALAVAEKKSSTALAGLDQAQGAAQPLCHPTGY